MATVSSDDAITLTIHGSIKTGQGYYLEITGWCYDLQLILR